MGDAPAAVRLPDAAWTRRADLAGLVAALGPGQARYVGGAVRDALLGEAAKDVDVATPLHPPEVVARLTAAGMRALPTGLAHGTITAVLPGGAVEVTTLREDVATDGRHATVAFAADWRADAARRDFTINALYADPATGAVFDWFGGLADLRARRVRFIGDPARRIAEDHLRILRYFRFTARFGAGAPDAAAEAACRALAPTLKGLSRERIGMETMRLLALPDPAPAVARMARLGVLAQVLPEAPGDTAVPALAALIAQEARQRIAPDPVRRLAALLPRDPALVDAAAARLRLSGPQRKRLASAAARDGDAPASAPASASAPALAQRALAYRIGVDEAIDRLLLTGADTSALAGWIPPRFPLKGGEVVARGIGAGPEIARVLHRVEDRWIAEGFPDRARIDALLAQELG